MTKQEKLCLQKAIEEHNVLLNRVRSINKLSNDEFDSLSETDRRRFDQDYGICIGMEQVFGLIGIKVDYVDD